MLLGFGPAARFTPGTHLTPAVTAHLGVTTRGSGPFLAARGTLAAPTPVQTGTDAEEMFSAEAGGLLGLRGGGRIAPVGAAELLVAYRNYRSGDLAIAKVVVPAVGAQVGADLTLPLDLTLRVSLDARYDLWSVHVYEPPVEDRRLSPLGFMLTTGLVSEIPGAR